MPKDEAVAQALAIVDINNVELENAQRELVEVEEVSTLNALAVARAKIDLLVDALSEARLALEECIKDRDDFKSQFKMLTKDVFLRHGKECVEPGFQHYRKLFLEPEGDYYNLKRAFHIARIFNVLNANDFSVLEISESIDGLHVFQMPEFTPTFLRGMKNEIGIYKAAIESTVKRDGTDNEFWIHCPGAEKYDKALREKNIRIGCVDPLIESWRDDPIEKARRIWEWWRIHHSKFVFFSKAVRLVVLVQVSSCAVERVFSQVKYILECIGDSGSKDNIEVRLMQRVNDYN